MNPITQEGKFVQEHDQLICVKQLQVDLLYYYYLVGKLSCMQYGRPGPCLLQVPQAVLLALRPSPTPEEGA